MSSASPVVRAQEEKAKKQKKLLAILSVVLLALMGYELPKMLGGHSSASSDAAVPSVAAESLPAAGAPVSAAPGTLPDTDRVDLQAGNGQLISFGLFKSKDPFVQQLSTDPTVAVPAPVQTTPDPLTPATLPTVSPAATTTQSHVPPVRSTITGRPVTTPSVPTLPASTIPSPSTTPITPTPVTPVTPTTVRSSTTPAPKTTTPATPVAAPTSVMIATNSVCEVVNKNGTFPGSEDIFRVVSIAKDGKSAKIAVVGGAYDSGTATVTIKLGEKVTLVNTADGTRYVILMKARCDVETSPVTSGAGTTTTSTTPVTTVAPPTTPSTVTTPIVTDALDTTTPTP